ncbi:MAG: hypothetical protein IPK76_19545 [Lewinellaceae bacterium]|nr:hypothetical protein [Lewinellaceae bacterium]
MTVKANQYTSVRTAPNGVKYMQRYYTFSSSQNQGGARTSGCSTDAEDQQPQGWRPTCHPATAPKTSTSLALRRRRGRLYFQQQATNGRDADHRRDGHRHRRFPAFYLEYRSPGFPKWALCSAWLPCTAVELLSFTGTARSRTAIRSGG